MYEIDDRFFDCIGFSKESVMTWGFRSWNDEDERWIVSINDARDFCKAIGADPAMAEI